MSLLSFPSGLVNSTTALTATSWSGSSTAPAATLLTTATPATPAEAAGASAIAPSDFRARLSALHPEDVYGAATGQRVSNGLMDILTTTNGVIFPYTPTITYSQAVNYTDLQLVHSNTDYPSYTRTPSVTLTVAGKFSVQNQREGQYALAVIHFLRTVSKSYFGELDKTKAGLPPPVLLFSAYGQYVYNNLRVILKSHSWNFDENMDTIAVAVPAIGTSSATTVRLPAMFNITTELTVVQTPQRMRTKFSFDAFASGQLMNTDGGWL